MNSSQLNIFFKLHDVLIKDQVPLHNALDIIFSLILSDENVEWTLLLPLIVSPEVSFAITAAYVFKLSD